MTGSRSTEAEAYVAHFQVRVLQDAWVEATAAYWRRRAERFEQAAPRAGDYTGRATEAQLDEQARRCANVATACRSRAVLGDLAVVELLETLLDSRSEAA